MISRLKVIASKLRIASIIQQGNLVNIKFHHTHKLTPQVLVGLSAAFERQMNIIGAETPTIVLKTRNSKALLLFRLQKILDEIKTMQESCSVV